MSTDIRSKVNALPTSSQMPPTWPDNYCWQVFRWRRNHVMSFPHHEKAELPGHVFYYLLYPAHLAAGQVYFNIHRHWESFISGQYCFFVLILFFSHVRLCILSCCLRFHCFSVCKVLFYRWLLSLSSYEEIVFRSCQSWLIARAVSCHYLVQSILWNWNKQKAEYIMH